jgi:hypothetical protein
MKACDRIRDQPVFSAILAAGLLVTLTTNVSAADMQPAGLEIDFSTAEHSTEQAAWREFMKQNDAPAEGCYQSSFPEVTWERTECEVAPLPADSDHAAPRMGSPDIVGNGTDYSAQAKGLITFAGGGFATKGVKTVKSVGVAIFNDAGRLGPNEYSLQINTNADRSTAVCHGHEECTVWQQFVYETDASGAHASVFIEYWLLNWGTRSCPAEWIRSHDNCFKNSAAVAAPNLPITDLDKTSLSGKVDAGGHDTVTLVAGSRSFTVIAKDNVLDISSVWRQAEFNVFGSSGGSRAIFNKGSAIDVDLLLFDGSTAAPSCVSDGGTTGESNNLSLGPCRAFGGIPGIHFRESN